MPADPHGAAADARALTVLAPVLSPIAHVGLVSPEPAPGGAGRLGSMLSSVSAGPVRGASPTRAPHSFAHMSEHCPCPHESRRTDGRGEPERQAFDLLDLGPRTDVEAVVSQVRAAPYGHACRGRRKVRAESLAEARGCARRGGLSGSVVCIGVCDGSMWMMRSNPIQARAWGQVESCGIRGHALLQAKQGGKTPAAC